MVVVVVMRTDGCAPVVPVQEALLRENVRGWTFVPRLVFHLTSAETTELPTPFPQRRSAVGILSLRSSRRPPLAPLPSLLPSVPPKPGSRLVPACVPRTFRSLSISRFHPLSYTLFLHDRVPASASFLVNSLLPPPSFLFLPSVTRASVDRARVLIKLLALPGVPRIHGGTLVTRARARVHVVNARNTRRGHGVCGTGNCTVSEVDFVFLIARRARWLSTFG